LSWGGVDDEWGGCDEKKKKSNFNISSIPLDSMSNYIISDFEENDEII
jgi:hypothetical protein